MQCPDGSVPAYGCSQGQTYVQGTYCGVPVQAPLSSQARSRVESSSAPGVETAEAPTAGVSAAPDQISTSTGEDAAAPGALPDAPHDHVGARLLALIGALGLVAGLIVQQHLRRSAVELEVGLINERSSALPPYDEHKSGACRAVLKMAPAREPGLQGAGELASTSGARGSYVPPANVPPAAVWDD